MKKELFSLLMPSIMLASGCASTLTPWTGTDRSNVAQVPLRTMSAQDAANQILIANRNISYYHTNMTFFMNLSIDLFGAHILAATTNQVEGDVDRANKELSFDGVSVMETNSQDGAGGNGTGGKKVSEFSVTVKDGMVAFDNDGNVTTYELASGDWVTKDYQWNFASILNGSTFEFSDDAYCRDASPDGGECYVLKVTPASMETLKDAVMPPVIAEQDGGTVSSEYISPDSYVYRVWINKVNLHVQKVHAEIAMEGSGYSMVSMINASFEDMR